MFSVVKSYDSVLTQKMENIGLHQVIRNLNLTWQGGVWGHGSNTAGRVPLFTAWWKGGLLNGMKDELCSGWPVTVTRWRPLTIHPWRGLDRSTNNITVQGHRAANLPGMWLCSYLQQARKWPGSKARSVGWLGPKTGTITCSCQQSCNKNQMSEVCRRGSWQESGSSSTRTTLRGTSPRWQCLLSGTSLKKASVCFMMAALVA